MDENGIPVECVVDQKGLSVTMHEGSATITYQRKCELFRGIKLLIENYHNQTFYIEQKAAFEHLGLMVDNSRDAVLNPSSIRKLICFCASMGYDRLMLYIEDTFEVENEPFFGYMRGRYSEKEIKAADEFANSFGIELIPCIQTLAHLNGALRWGDYQKIVDCNDILLVGDEKTYSLIDNIFKTLSKNFSTRNVNIGMDEAHMLGLGKYLDLHGYQNRTEIMLKHLDRVLEICRKYGFKASMWSDMFFRLAFQGEYYEKDGRISEEVSNKIPSDLTLVYWDYYNDKEEHYENMIKRHKQITGNVSFAGGAWKWIGFAPNNRISLKNSTAALTQCKKQGINDVFVTAWGDNGAECSVFAILPTLDYFANECYGDTSHSTAFKELNLDSFFALDLPNELYENKKDIKLNNACKYLLYNDPLLGFLDSTVVLDKFSDYYKNYREVLENEAIRNRSLSYVFSTLAKLCGVLEIKCDLGLKLKRHYDEKNMEGLKEISEKRIPDLLNLLDDFYHAFKKQWMTENKPFGFEIHELRIGGLMLRIKSTRELLIQYLNNEISTIEELDFERLDFAGDNADEEHKNVLYNNWHLICSPNILL
jgi:hypothetical protein